MSENRGSTIVPAEVRPYGLQYFRKKMGLTVEELSYMSGLSVYTIHAYEQAKRHIEDASFSTIIKLCQILYCKPYDLIYDCSLRHEVKVVLS